MHSLSKLNIKVTNYLEKDRGLLISDSSLTNDEMCFIFPMDIKLKYINKPLTDNRDLVIVNVNRIRYSQKPRSRNGETYRMEYEKNFTRYNLYVLEHIGNIILLGGFKNVLFVYNEDCIRKYGNNNNNNYFIFNKSLNGWILINREETNKLFIK